MSIDDTIANLIAEQMLWDDQNAANLFRPNFGAQGGGVPHTPAAGVLCTPSSPDWQGFVEPLGPGFDKPLSGRPSNSFSAPDRTWS